MTGYPMFGPSDNNKQARVEHIQKLPASAHVLAISGSKDECINKNAPPGGKVGKELWDEVMEGMAGSENVSVEFVDKGGHGVYVD